MHGESSYKRISMFKPHHPLPPFNMLERSSASSNDFMCCLEQLERIRVFAQLIIKKLDSETDNTKVGATRKSPRISCRKSQWMYIQNTYDKIPQIMAASFPLLGIRSESPASFASITAQPSS